MKKRLAVLGSGVCCKGCFCEGCEGCEGALGVGGFALGAVVGGFALGVGVGGFTKEGVGE